jgi:hypothetical protein
MDQDVKLSMEQAHAKWITKTIVIGVLGLIAISAGTCSYNSHSSDNALIQKSYLDQEKAKADAMKAMWDHQPAPPAK